MRKLLTALILCLCVTNAQSAYFSGNSLLSKCTSDTEVLTCYGYLMAAVDMYETWENWGDMEEQMCVPPNVTAGQLKLIILKYMEKAPEELHKTAGSFVINALITAFPCEK